MSRKKKSPKRSNQNRTAKAGVRKKSINWLKWAKGIAVTVVLAAVASFAIAAYMEKLEVEQDLSVIGQGKPTVVQIHDPGCQLCQQLKSNVDKAKREFKDDIHFKIVNIKTNKGRRFANKYQVPHVTLLFFDGEGRHVNTINGVTPTESIKTALTTLNSL